MGFELLHKEGFGVSILSDDEIYLLESIQWSKDVGELND